MVDGSAMSVSSKGVIGKGISVGNGEEVVETYLSLRYVDN